MAKTTHNFKFNVGDVVQHSSCASPYDGKFTILQRSYNEGIDGSIFIMYECRSHNTFPQRFYEGELKATIEKELPKKQIS